MKVCFLILAHKNLAQIECLCKALQHKDSEIFIHLDKKMKKITGIDRIESLKNVHVISERYSCYLDDWSLINATLALVRNAYECIGDSISHFALLSGQDYPIKPVDELICKLQLSFPQPYIDCTPYDPSNWVFHKFQGTRILHYARFLKARCPFKLRIIYLCSRFEKLLPQGMKVCNKIKKYGVELFGGSAWWILPKPIMDEVLQITADRPEIVKCYKLSNTPEETFFQTFAMMTSMAERIHVNPVDQVSQSCLTYANFFSPRKGFVGHPHIITSEDYEWLKQRPEYLARKFDMDVDDRIFDMLNDSFRK